MNAILHRIVEGNLSDFRGLAIEGEIPVSERFLNEIIRLFIEEVNASKGETSSDTSVDSSTKKEKIDINKIVSALDEKNISIELKDKQLVLKVNARKY